MSPHGPACLSVFRWTGPQSPFRRIRKSEPSVSDEDKVFILKSSDERYVVADEPIAISSENAVLWKVDPINCLPDERLERAFV